MWVIALWGCAGGRLQDAAFEPGRIPGTGAVTFAGHLEGLARVEWRDEDGDLTSTPAVDAAAGRVPVLGLPAATDLELTVVVEDGGRTFSSEPIEVRVVPARTVPPMTVLVDRPEKRCLDGGYVLTSYISDDASGVGLLDRRGRWVWSLDLDVSETGVRVARARPGRDGASILYNVAHADLEEDLGETVRVSMDGSDEVRTRTRDAHHDFVELPDGTQAWLGYAIRELDDATFGSTPGACALGGRGFDDDGDEVSDGCVVAVTTVVEGPEGGTGDEGTTVFDLFTDIPQPVTSHGPPDAFLGWAYDWDHGNSLVYGASDDSWYVLSRWIDTLWKVDREGGLVWQLGGDHSDFTGSAEDAFVHAHMSEVWEGGMMVYDNHNADEPGEQDGPTRVVEYALDEQARTFEAVWQWSTGGFDDILGDARRMPIEGCDNVLVTRAADAHLVEVTRDGEVVWEVGSSGFGAILTRGQFLPDLYDFSGVAY